MTPLAVVVAILAVVTLLNVALSAAIIRLLRELTGRGKSVSLPRTGHTVTSFSVPALDGTTISESSLNDEDSLVAFVSPTCAPCATLMEEWPKRTDDLPATTIAFVINTSTADEAEEYAAKFGPGVQTAVVDRDSAAAQAFDCSGATPTLIRVRAGAVTAAGHALDRI
ncbi:MAG: thioredoxin family protein, partial [Actinocatenispora sp.]